jgi:hypothetical protein
MDGLLLDMNRKTHIELVFHLTLDGFLFGEFIVLVRMYDVFRR